MERCRHRCRNAIALAGLVAFSCLAVPRSTTSGQQNPLDVSALPARQPTADVPAPLPVVPPPQLQGADDAKPRLILPHRVPQQAQLQGLYEDVRALRAELQQLTRLLETQVSKSKTPTPAPLPEPRAAEKEQRAVLRLPLRNTNVREMEQPVRMLLSEKGNVTSLERTNELIVLDDSENLKLVLDLVRQLEKVPPQIRIRVHAFELSTATVERLMADPSSVLGKLNVAGSPVWTIEDVTVALTSLMENPDVKLISRPQVITLDRQAACIKTGQEFPVQQLTQSSDGSTISTTTFREAGFSLELTPWNNHDGTLVLEYKQEISLLAGFTPDTNAPIIDRRQSNARLRLRSGQSILIGGLSGVVRRDIPNSSQANETTSKTEFLVILTPEILENEVAKFEPRPTLPEAAR